MKIAVTAENNNGLDSMVAQHFGHAPYFMLVDVENGEVTTVESAANPYAEAHQPGQIPAFIKQLNANVILSGGMGGRAIEFFEQALTNRNRVLTLHAHAHEDGDQFGVAERLRT